jgi:hypothetical protein
MITVIACSLYIRRRIAYFSAPYHNGFMKTLALVLCAVAFSAADSSRLSQVHSVYLMPMGNGLDQYLANRVTEWGVFQVVTDASKADAVFSDRLGESMEKKLRELNPPPPEPVAKPDKPAASDKKDDEKKEAEPKTENVRPQSSFARGKGNIFLIDRKSGNVVWSHFQKPRNAAPEELDRTARQIVQELKRDLGAK